MNFKLECKKMKRTGLITAFLSGGVLAAIVPIVNMAVRAENYLGMDASPVLILMDANWQMMAMLNLLLVVAGGCLMYHTEYAENAMQRMCTLPIKERKLFFSKAALMAGLCAVVLLIEATGILFCTYRWFELSADIWIEIMQSFGYAMLLILPGAFGALLIASMCKNMWVSLGIGIICVFTAILLPVKNFWLSLFPFALPFQTFAGTETNSIYKFMLAAIIECLIIGLAEVLFIKIRRLMQ